MPVPFCKMNSFTERQFLTFQEAKELMSDSYSCFKLQTSVKHVLLSPRYIGNVKQGVVEQLSTELQLYSDKMEGVLIAFDNVRLLQNTGNVIESQPWVHMDIQADFIVFQPGKGSVLKGVINKLGRDHIGCIVHRCFNASILKPRDADSDWQNNFKVGQEVIFQVLNLYSNNRVLSLRGRLHHTGEESFQTPNRSSQTVNQFLSPTPIKGSSLKRKNDELSIAFDTSTPDHHSKKQKVEHIKSESIGVETLTSSVLESTVDSSTDDPNTSKKHKKKKKKKEKDMSDYISSIKSEKLGSDDSGIGSHKSHKKKKKRKHKEIVD
ncbi:DNA-directed RNA polymerase I subunit RPA43-like [Lingula anatina]|uniref:DNA-directed RNA polymerase I subunit RPA43 n=1 Tax=Lingula anatina TaxID=7574 RepID=A0A1S3IX91_LINAN|nr:DNA-directed RNA polymerase I subunit RPA43-like [Lingula anatina]XP_023931231.1 DNA-directed RNA polymerase I subunit RPA43-like [Lingula anatina]|eukprot:XP_013402576.2 DNA-directed RNA polymerase I subunit RPA43-like [Lingula anatina]